MPGRYEPEPSNYEVLPAGKPQPGPALDSVSHDRLHAGRRSGWIDLELVTIDPVHVGAGSSSPHEGDLARDMVVTRRGSEELPVVPGASIKGAIRNLAEALGGGCDQDQKHCEPPCPTCSLFGHLMKVGGFLGRVGFGDALPTKPEFGIAKLPIPFQPRKAEGRRIYTVPNPQRSGPVPYWVIPRNAKLRCRMTVTNVSTEELGLVMLAAGVDGTFRLRLGGGKFAGLGRVAVTPTAASFRGDYSGPPERWDAERAGQETRAAIEAFQKKVAGHQAALGKIRSVLR